MTKIKRGDVVLVEVIFSSGGGAKLRPALVLSTNDYNKNRGEIIISGITSNTKQTHKGDTEIIEWEKAGLKVPSLATAILQTVKKDRVQKCLGTLEVADFQKIERNIFKILEPTSFEKVMVGNPKELLDMGRSFYFVSQKFHSSEFSSGKILSCIIPSIVCNVFALELLLKCYSSVRNKWFFKTHSISVLYNSLPEEDKKGIQNKLNVPQKVFGEEIKILNLAFEKWRYTFDSKSLSFDSKFAESFCKGLLETFDANLKSWFPSINGKSLVVNR